MRIKKLAGGGLPAFVSYTNVEQALPAYAGIGSSSASAESTSSSKSSSSKSGSSSDIGFLNKEMQKILMENGLPSDVQYFLQKADVFGNSVDPLDPHSQERIYTKLLSMLPEIKQNKAEYDDAIKHAREKGTLDQVAVTKDGHIYVRDRETGKIDLKSPSAEIDEAKFERLTNGQLLQMRAYVPGHAMDKGGLTTLVASSISFADIEKSITDKIDKLGKSTMSREGFVRKDSKNAELMKGYEQIIGQGEDGVYKVTSKTISQNSQAKAFLNYLSKSLSRQERAVLMNRASENGTTVEEVLVDLLQGRLTDEQDIKVSFDNQATKGATDNEGKRIGDIQVTGLYEYQTGMGGQNENITLVPGGHTAMVVSGQFYGQPVGNDGKPIQRTSLSNFLNQGIASISDVRNGVYFGNQRIDPSKYDQIMYDGTQLSRAILPYTLDKNGTIHPDFDLIKKFTEAYKTIKSGNYNVQDQIRILREHGFEDYLLPDGSWNPNKVKPFLMTKAYGSASSSGFLGMFGKQDGVVDPALVEIDDEQFLVEQKDSKGIQSTMINTLSSKDHPVSVGDKIYAGMIFIPVLNSTDTAMIASGQHPVMAQNSNSLKQNDIRYIDTMKKSSNYVSASASKLE